MQLPLPVRSPPPEGERRRFPDMKPHRFHGLALGSYFSLLVLTLVWHAWLFPSAYFPISLVLIVTALPLLLPLRGLLHGRPRSHIWVALLSMLYFVHGVGEAIANPQQRWLGLLEILFSLTLVFSATLYVRLARISVVRSVNATSLSHSSNQTDQSA